MEEILKSFLLEKDTSISVVEERTKALEAYVYTLGVVIGKTKEAAKAHKEGITDLLSQIKSHQDEVQSLRDTHTKDKSSHAKWVEAKDSEISSRNKDIADKEDKVVQLDKKIDGLNSERTTAERSLSTLSGQVSAMNRAVGSTKKESTDLEGQVSKAKDELASTLNQLEAAQKSLSRAKEDAAILEARKK